MNDIRAIPPLFEGEDVEELSKHVNLFQEYARKKRNWENAFQRWSDKVAQDDTTPLGKCGYGSICDYCSDNHIGRPCVRAINEKARVENLRIDYDNRDFAEWFYL